MRQLPRWVWTAVVAAALAVLYYLFRDHLAHVIAFLPYLVLLACPLMHLFMHHRHHGGRG